MGRWPVIARIYGYLVCLLAICVTFWSLAVLVEAVFDLGDPMHAEELQPYYYRDLSSFEAFKLDVLRSPALAAGKRDIPDDRTIQAAYEAAKAHQVGTVIRKARTNLTLSSLLVVVCIALFITHWKWASKLPGPEASTAQPPTP